MEGIYMTRVETNLKKLLALVLCFVMAIGVLPLTADLFTTRADAADTVVNAANATQFNQAAANATGPVTIRLTADINANGAPIAPAEYAFTSGGRSFTKLSVPQGKTVTLDMNGHNILWVNYEKDDEWFLSHNFTSGAQNQDYMNGTFMGCIENRGNLTITGNGTIENLKIDLESACGTNRAFNQRICAVYNRDNGRLTVTNGVKIKTFMSYAEQSSDSAKGLNCSMYLAGIYQDENASVVSTGEISVGSFNALQIPTGAIASRWSAFGNTFSYGIYGGGITVNGGTINCESYTGGYWQASNCGEDCNYTSFTIGLFTPNKQIKVFNNARINCTSKIWASKGEDIKYKSITNGGGVAYATGVMYNQNPTDVPVIGPGVNINCTSRMLTQDGLSTAERAIAVPGLTNAIYNNFGAKPDGDKPNSLFTIAVPVAEVVQNHNNIDVHTAPGEAWMSSGSAPGNAHQKWWTDGGYLGVNTAQQADYQYVYPVSTRYMTENTYREWYNRKNASYLADCNDVLRCVHYHDTMSNLHALQNSQIKNGAPGTSSGQAIVCYRFMKGSNPVKVAFGKDNMGTMVIDHQLDLQPFASATSSAAQVINGVSQSATLYNNYIRKFAISPAINAKTITVSTSEFTQRDRDNPDPSQWTKDSFTSASSQSNSGATLSPNKVVVLFCDFNMINSTSSYITVKKPGTQFTTDRTTWKVSEPTITTNYTGRPIDESAFDLWFFNEGTQTRSRDDDERMTGLTLGTDYHIYYKPAGPSYPDSTYSETGPINPGTYTVKVVLDARTNFDVFDATNTKKQEQIFELIINATPADIHYNSGQFDLTYGETLGEVYQFVNWNQYFTIRQADAQGGTFAFNPDDAVKIYQASSTLQDARVHWTPPAGSSYSPMDFVVAVKVNPKNITVTCRDTYIRQGASNPKYKYVINGVIPDDEVKAETWKVSFLVNYQGQNRAYGRDIAVGDYVFTLNKVTGTGTSNYRFTNPQPGYLHVQAVNRYNVAPTLTITGKMQAEQTVTAVVGNTRYTDKNGLQKDGITMIGFQWYTVDEDGVFALIPGANSKSYKVKADDAGKYLGVAIYAVDLDESEDALKITNSNENLTINGDVTECITYDCPTMVTAKKLTFLQRLFDWIRRFIAAITGMVLGTAK